MRRTETCLISANFLSSEYDAEEDAAMEDNEKQSKVINSAAERGKEVLERVHMPGE